jgi:hypothetical protein
VDRRTVNRRAVIPRGVVANGWGGGDRDGGGKHAARDVNHDLCSWLPVQVASAKANRRERGCPAWSGPMVVEAPSQAYSHSTPYRQRERAERREEWDNASSGR